MPELKERRACWRPWIPAIQTIKNLISFYKNAIKDLNKAADAQTAAAKNAKGAELKTLANIGIAADKVILDEGMTAAGILQPLLVRNAQLGVGGTQQLIDVLPVGHLKNRALQLQAAFQDSVASATALAQDIKHVRKNNVEDAKDVLNSIAKISAQLKAHFATLSELKAALG